MSDSKASRLSALGDEIGYALGRGEIPDDMLREFRWLWKTTPDQEKDGLSVALKDIEDMIKDFRRELAIANGAGQLRRIPVTTGRPSEHIG